MTAVRLENPSCRIALTTTDMRDMFFTSPQDSPSGVSLGHSMPHVEGCSVRGPLTLRLFSKWL